MALTKNPSGTDIQPYNDDCEYIVAEGSRFFGPALVTKEDGSSLVTSVQFREGEKVVTNLSPGANLVPTCKKGEERRKKHEDRAAEAKATASTRRMGLNPVQVAQIAEIVKQVNA